MAKYRDRKIAGVSIANPRRTMKKVARAYTSLHYSDGLKDESTRTPRSFADFIISTDFPSANVRGAIGGRPMGRWQHLSGLRGRSHFTVPFCRTANVGKLSLRHQRTVESSRPADLAGRSQKAGTEEAQGPIPAGRRSRRGRARASNRGRGL